MDHSVTPPSSHPIYPQWHTSPHIQRNRNFCPWGRGGRGAPRPWGPRGQFHRAPRVEIYNSINDDEHWCETCDRSFKTVDLLQQHERQHEKCNIDGCEFTAHPKVITKHIQMQHSTGLFKKIANLKNPEDIEKWREERRKKYPTKENVAKKAAEIKEKIERGEKMGLRQDKNKFGRNHKPGEAQKIKFPQRNENNYSLKKISMTKINEPNNIKNKKKDKAIPAAKDKQNLKPFGGIQGLIIDSDLENVEEPEQSSFIIEDDDAQDTLTIKTEEPMVCGALSSLMCEYGSSEDEIEAVAKIEQVPTIINRNTNHISRLSPVNMKTDRSDEASTLDPKNIQATKNINLDHKDSDEDDSCGPEEVKVEKLVEESINLNNKEKVKPVLVSSRKTNPDIKIKKHIIKRTKPKVPSTLIYKLLHKEIQQERNIVLQCIRHIVKHNYFDNNIILNDHDQ